MTKSPWDIPDDITIDSVPADPVSDGLADTPSGPETEAETWRRRAHELWSQARADGNVQGQAAAINSALRHLKADVDAATKAASNTQGGISEERRREIEIAALDKIVAATEDHRQKHQTLCPCCHSYGDRLRIARFQKWLDEQDGRAADFAAWNARTPYKMSATSEEKGGSYLDDEINDNTITN